MVNIHELSLIYSILLEILFGISGPNNMNPTLHMVMNDPQKKYRIGTVSKNILLEGLNWFLVANNTLSSDVDQDTQMLVCMKDP